MTDDPWTTPLWECDGCHRQVPKSDISDSWWDSKTASWHVICYRCTPYDGPTPDPEEVFDVSERDEEAAAQREIWPNG